MSPTPGAADEAELLSKKLFLLTIAGTVAFVTIIVVLCMN